ncbi:RluA family pseudouridine synthase [candidate division WOR-3 bacterium]|nr:RluA family pseudouridine synthase [candidate division WOR-3 bacterium]
MLNGNLFTKKVDSHQSRIRLDSFLSSSGAPTSRSRLKKLIEDGFVSVNGETVRVPHHYVKRGDVLIVAFPKEPVMSLEPENIDIKIAYEDDEIIVVDKRAGLVVHPAKGNREGTLVNALLFHSSLSESGSLEHRPGIVHRLDKDTSGLMVTVKTETAYRNLQNQISSRKMKREYLALVWGQPDKNGTIEAPIGRSTVNRKKMAVTSYRSKDARTHFRTLVNFGAATLVLCSLDTGRTHQIRVHMKHIGHPVIGDREYGGATSYPQGVSGKWSFQVEKIRKLVPRQFLHAARLSFEHPRDGKGLKFYSPLPEELRPVLLFLSEQRSIYLCSV